MIIAVVSAFEPSNLLGTSVGETTQASHMSTGVSCGCISVVDGWKTAHSTHISNDGNILYMELPSAFVLVPVRVVEPIESWF